MDSSTLRARLSPALLALSACLFAACSLLNTAANAPARVASAVIPGQKEKEAPPSAEALLNELMRMADMIVLRVDEASRQLERDGASVQADLDASRIRLETLRRTNQMATSPNTLMGLLDLQVYVVATGFLMEDYWIPEVYGEAARPLLVAAQENVSDGWKLLEHSLPKGETDELRLLLQDWRTEHPKVDPDSMVAFPTFSSFLKERATSKASSNLLGFVGLDPLAGLEGPSRQIAESRLFGIRALFFAQRAPRMVAAETEYRLMLVRQAPETRQALDDTQRITASVESVAATAAAIPALLTSERQAILEQLLAGLDVQTAKLRDDLASSKEPMQELLAQTQATLDAGTAMSHELTGTLATLDAFVGRFDRPDEPPAQPEPGAAEAKPFDIAEYGMAAERIGHAAGELQSLIASLDERIPEVQRLVDEVAARGDRTVDHALLRVLQVGLALIAAAAVARLVLRGRGTPRPAGPA